MQPSFMGAFSIKLALAGEMIMKIVQEERHV